MWRTLQKAQFYHVQRVKVLHENRGLRDESVYFEVAGTASFTATVCLKKFKVIGVKNNQQILKKIKKCLKIKYNFEKRAMKHIKIVLDDTRFFC